MVEILSADQPDDGGFADAARLLHDFNVEYDEPTPPSERLAPRLVELSEAERITVLLARDREGGTPVGVAVLRLEPSVWSEGFEAYLAELYVVPDRRGQGYGRELMDEALRFSREQGADYAYLITSEDDHAAQRLYKASGFRRTEGEDGAIMLAFERDL